MGGMVSAGLIYVVYSGNMNDMSIPLTMAMAGMLTVQCINLGFPLAMLIGILSGALIGLINGIMIGKTVNPIRWESSMSDDGFQDTHLIFLFCVSADKEFARNHMMLLSELAGKLGNDVRVTKLSQAQTKEEIKNLILCEDDELGEVDKVLNEEEIVDLDIDF